MTDFMLVDCDENKHIMARKYTGFLYEFAIHNGISMVFDYQFSNKAGYASISPAGKDLMDCDFNYIENDGECKPCSWE